MFSSESIRVEMSERTRAVAWGGLSVVRQLLQRLQVAQEIDASVSVLRRHHPFHESDHVLSLVFNLLTGGRTIEDIERRRTDLAFLDAVGARRVPGATTAGDFLRRFEDGDVIDLLEASLAIGKRAWKGKRGKDQATIDIDGTIAEVHGECREGADMAYNGKWGYGPLLVSLANSSEVLYVENRPASCPSHVGAPEILDRCAEACLDRGFDSVLFRGDTAFSSIAHLDRWDQKGYRFVFGMKAHAKALALAEGLKEGDFRRLVRPTRNSDETRARLFNHRSLFVAEKEYKNLELEEEHVAEVPYSTRRCKREFRVIILRKRIKVSEGQRLLEPETRYFFYITNLPKGSHGPAEIVAESNQRCHQEKLIEQLKNQLPAMRMPTKSLVANWAYLAIGCLAWNLTAWLTLFIPKKIRPSFARRDFRSFYHDLMLIPAQILRTGRRTIFRLLGYKETLPWLLAAHRAVS